MLAGTGSGCGKTTVTMLLLSALTQKGLKVAPCKAGPDYIDPGFHQAVCGYPCYNLDSWLMPKEALLSPLQNDRDITVIEGVMGYYDGLGGTDFACSSYDLARLTDTPAVLIVDASGGAVSVAATVKGFMSLVTDSKIAGVIVNRASGERHYQLVKQAVERYTAAKCLGYIEKQAAIELPSRHLGLVPAEETGDLRAKLDEATQRALETLDISGLLALAKTAPAVCVPARPALPDLSGRRIGVARDKAFHFYYQANLDALKEAGAELVFFSPLSDAGLPEGLNALYIGGGYPEMFKETLFANASMRKSIFDALSDGLKCYAECGGLMYLGQAIDGVPMVGFLPLECEMTKRLQRFGYVRVREESGLIFPAHEFHHAKSTPLAGARLCYRVSKVSAPETVWECGYTKNRTLAAFAHSFFACDPALIERFFD